MFRDKVQKDLKLTGSRKKSWSNTFRNWLPDAMKFFEKIDGLKREEREKELEAYRPKAQEKLAAFLKETLKEDQRKRCASWSCSRRGRSPCITGTRRSGKT